MKPTRCWVFVVFLFCMGGASAQSTSVRIPIDGDRWYQLNNTGIKNMRLRFDSISPLQYDIATNGDYFSWPNEMVMDYFEAYYPILPGEKISIDRVRLFDGQGDKFKTMVMYYINSKWEKKPFIWFNGANYGWTGPVDTVWNAPIISKYLLDSAITDIKYLVLASEGKTPAKIELYGTYTPPTNVPAVKPRHYPLKNYFGMNGFVWHYLNNYKHDEIDTAKLKTALYFNGVRCYVDWQNLEPYERQYFYYHNTTNGEFSFDTVFQAIKKNNQDLLVCIKTLPNWMKRSYYDKSVPDTVMNSEQNPCFYDTARKHIDTSFKNAYYRKLSEPATYKEQARLAFQFAARYGRNVNADSGKFVHVTDSIKWGYPQSKRFGIGFVKYIECENERNKDWKYDTFALEAKIVNGNAESGRRTSYQTGREYAANLSAFYDGDMGRLKTDTIDGKYYKYGVKTADTTMQVVMNGVSNADLDYVKGMIDWCKEFRGYKPDGSVNYAWDVINYHHYDNVQFDTVHPTKGPVKAYKGISPENSKSDSLARAFVSFSAQFGGNLPIWVTEMGGYDSFPYPYSEQFVPNQIGKKGIQLTRADWILRSCLLYARRGIEKTFVYELYDNDTTKGQYNSCGLADSNGRRPAGDYMLQTARTFGNHVYQETIDTFPIVDRYYDSTVAKHNTMFSLVRPTQTGDITAYTLNTGTDTAIVYYPTVGDSVMRKDTVRTLTGTLPLRVTETPCFVVAAGKPVTTKECLAGNPVTVSDTLSRSDSSSNLFLTGDVVLASNSNVVWKSNVAMFDTGASLIVGSGASLRIVGSRLGTCWGRWKGIRVRPGGTLIFDPGNNAACNLVEDADTAVLFEGSDTLAMASGNSIVGTLFNGNRTSVALLDQTAITSGDSLFPLTIRGNVFTGRQLSAPGAQVWPNVDSLKSVAYNTSYGAPYMDTVRYPARSLKNARQVGLGAERPATGIYLSGDAGFDATGLRARIVIGDPTALASPTGFNLFDNLDRGIKARKTNLVLRNNVFQATWNYGVGVDIDNEVFERTRTVLPDGSIFSQGQILSDYLVDISAPSGYLRNAFFDQAIAIILGAGAYSKVADCDIRSTQAIGNIADRANHPNGNTGVSVNSNNYESLKINNNSFQNIGNAIAVSNSLDRTAPGTTSNYGTIEVTDDTIVGKPANGGVGNEFVEKGIVFSAFQLASNSNGSKPGPIVCKRNKIINVFNGIMASGWVGKNVNIEGNQIQLTELGAQYGIGISMEGGTGDGSSNYANTVTGNVVTGIGFANNASTTGIQLKQQSNTELGCNYVGGHQNGFCFVNENLLTKFWDNTMDTTNQVGLRMQDNAIIGTQGMFDRFNCGSNNSWTSVNGWDSTKNHFMTYSKDSYLGSSKMVIYDKPAYPFLNPNSSAGGNIRYMEYKYLVSDSTLVLISNQTPDSCVRCKGSVVYNFSGTGTTEIDEILEEIATGVVNLPADEAEDRLKALQEKLYEILKDNPDYRSNINLQQFLYQNRLGSLEIIRAIGGLVRAGQYGAARLLLYNWDDANDDRVDESFRTYYEWVLRIAENPEWHPDEDELRELLERANDCPSKSGVVVYAFRNLYNALTGNFNNFEDNCDGGTVGRAQPGSQQGPKQFIRLRPKPVAPKAAVSKATLRVTAFPSGGIYPNPADGFVILGDKDLAHVVVTDRAGRTVIEKRGSNIGRLSTTDLPNGAYFVRTTGAGNESRTLILTVQH